MINGFKKVAEYTNINDSITLTVTDLSVKKSRRVSLVYLMVVDNEIKYIGKSIQGYRRPFTYHKNEVMKDVNNGIKESTKIHSKPVHVYTREMTELMQFEDEQLDICEALEQALIKRIKPQWNNHIQR